MTRTAIRISLRKLFALLVCFGVGIAASISCQQEIVRRRWLLTLEGLPWLFFEVLIATGAAALLPVLVRQVRILRKSNFAVKDESVVQRYSVTFAIVWRVFLAIALAVCLILEILLTQGFIKLPESGDFLPPLYNWFPPEFVEYACVVVVLSACLDQFLGGQPRKPLRRWKFVAVWSSGVVLGLIVLTQSLIIHFLVYVALNGVEASQAAVFQRPGTYPNFQAEGHSLFWVSLAAVVCVAIASGLWIASISNIKSNRLARVLMRATALLLLCFPVCFAYWYFTEGLPTIAPDFAEAGLQGRWWHWCEAAVLLFILIPAGAYRIASEPASCFEVKNVSLCGKPFLHGLLPPSIIIATAGLCYIIALVIGSLEYDETLSGLLDSLADYITNVNIYLPLAMFLLSLNLVWKQLRSDETTRSLRLSVIEPERYMWACLTLIFLAVVGTPTIAAFCFCYWLGPWVL